MRFLLLTCGSLAMAAGAAVLFAAPTGAAPALRPAFEDAICHAKPPRIAHAWARGISVPEPGQVIRVAAPAAISNEDHAELLFKIGLLEGHLMVGRELIEANQPRLALPHFGHPVRELYDDIQGELRRRGITAFDGELIALEAMVAGKPRDPATMAKYDGVIRILAAVRSTVPSNLLDNERFMLGVLGEVATIASEDYSESIESGRIEKPVEYHDSRGYLLYASQEMKRLEGRPDLRGSPRLAAARARLTDMQAIVGPLIPPERPIKSVSAYKAIVGQFKQAAAAGA
ncbi:MAG TPA: hypothetical protein VGC15_09410 [Acetobacteraceae bacterium]